MCVRVYTGLRFFVIRICKLSKELYALWDVVTNFYLYSSIHTNNILQSIFDEIRDWMFSLSTVHRSKPFGGHDSFARL